ETRVPIRSIASPTHSASTDDGARASAAAASAAARDRRAAAGFAASRDECCRPRLRAKAAATAVPTRSRPARARRSRALPDRREPVRCASALNFRMLGRVDRARSTRMELLIVVIIVAAVVVWAIAIYNRLVGLRNRVRNAFSQIDVQLKRRYDLIPNRVEAV